MTRESPFADIRALIGALPQPDDEAAVRAAGLFARMAKPAGSLGRIEEMAVWLSRWSGRVPPHVDRPLVAIFAGNHGVVRRSVSPRRPEATAAAVEMCAAGGAAVNQLCLAANLGLKVFDLALDLPTQDICQGPALDERACVATIAFGMEAVVGGTDLVCIGDIGVGGTTASAALCAALFGGRGRDWAGPGSGADAAMVERKAEAVDAALALAGDAVGDPLEALRRLGGREHAAIVGAILAARAEKVPVVLDGFAAMAAAAVLWRMEPGAVGHCMAAVRMPEPGHSRAAAAMGLAPLVDFDMSHGEGAGAALAGGLVRASALTLAGMAAAL